MSAVPHDIAVVSTHRLSANPFHWVGEEKLHEESRRGAMLFLLNNAWASGTVLRPFLQPESPLSSRLRLQVQASGFQLTTPILKAARSNN